MARCFMYAEKLVLLGKKKSLYGDGIERIIVLLFIGRLLVVRHIFGSLKELYGDSKRNKGKQDR